jgi:flagellar protein FlaG
MMSVASVGTGINTLPELPQDKGSSQRAQIQTARQRAIVIKGLEAAMPENGSSEQRPQVLDSIAEDLERVSRAFNKKLQFVVDHRSNEVIVKVIDRETDKVIKELPPEELRRLHRKLKETIGFLFDERV